MFFTAAYLLQALLNDSLTLDSLFLMAPSDLEQLLVKYDINPDDSRRLVTCLDQLNSFYGEQDISPSLFLSPSLACASTSLLSSTENHTVIHVTWLSEIYNR